MLKTKVVGKYTASQIGALQGANLRIHQRKIEAMKPGEAENEAYQEWALVAACVSPYIPLDEWLQTPLMDLRPIIEAVEELNSEMAQVEPAAKKKKIAKSTSE